MFCLSVESGLYGREIKSIRSSCPLVFPLPTQTVKTLQGLCAFFYINQGEITFKFFMSSQKSVGPGYEKMFLKIIYVLFKLLDFS